MERRTKAILVGVALVVGSVLSAGCSSTTFVDTRPSGAQITVDETYYVGQAPLKIRELPWVWSSRQYRFERQGYHVEYHEMEATMSRAHLLMCLCMGAWPAMFFGRFPERVVTHLEPRSQASNAEFSRDPSVSFGPQ